MKKITKDAHNIICKRVISEPGDKTRYDYIYTKDGPDDYVFMPYGNYFKYPQRINYWSVKGVKLPVLEDEKNYNITDETILEIAKFYNCNAYTVAECIRTVLEDHNAR